MIEANTLGRHAYGEDDTEALISKSTWSLKLSGLIFAGLLIIGRSASYGNITWTPTFHQANSPLIVVEILKSSTPPRAPVPKTLPSIDAAAISKRAAAAEIIQFSPGKMSGDDGDGSDSPGTPKDTGKTAGDGSHGSHATAGRS